MSRQTEKFDVLVVGGGPAGMAAAWCAAQGRGRVALVDDNHHLGGQIWRGGPGSPVPSRARAWIARVKDADVTIRLGSRLVHVPEPGRAILESFDGPSQVAYSKMVIATGARERFLPFPGWTLPNVVGAGGLQALVKSGLPIKGKRVVVAGTGPLLMAVAAYLRKRGARIKCIAEQADWSRLFQFALRLAPYPGKLTQALCLKAGLLGVKYWTGCRVSSAEGDHQLDRVHLRKGGQSWSIDCDYLACGFDLTPNIELPLLLGCGVANGSVQVNEWQESTVPGIYCAGEPTGVGGVEDALVEGQIAGFASVGLNDRANKLFRQRERHQRFAAALERAFSLDPAIRGLPSEDTLICRCEDVSFGRLKNCRSWREAKLQTRCGMGPCQGRVCGAATKYLFGWHPETVRPPLFTAGLSCFTLGHETGENGHVSRAINAEKL